MRQPPARFGALPPCGSLPAAQTSTENLLEAFWEVRGPMPCSGVNYLTPIPSFTQLACCRHRASGQWQVGW